ncbi:MAG: hypothetical protein JW384_03459 [Nitrosomonadaceae bacterium]|nr:hypothetical protein [Nitrosomonadaceae bacterium]
MRITNKHGAPQTLVNLALRDPYSKGAADVSVTELIGSPRISLLRSLHDSELEKDVGDMLWALVGSALHGVAERGADDTHLAEERLFAEMDGWVISGGIDVQKIGDNVVALSDYKFTSVWSVMNDKPEWEAQLNCYAWLMRRSKGLHVTGLSIHALLRDWNRHSVGVKQGYPPSAIHTVNIPVWSDAKQDLYIKERVALHQEARSAHDLDAPVPECTDADRWMKQDSYAVMKDGRKTAIRVTDTAIEAGEVLARTPGAYVKIRKGEPTRCVGDYCSVSRFCEQHAGWLRDNQGHQPEL